MRGRTRAVPVRLASVALVALVALVAAAVCGACGGGDTAAVAALSEDDVQAAVDAVNAVDARLAGVGTQKAVSPDVRRFASRLGSTHRQKVTDRPPPVAGAGGEALVAPLHAFELDAASRLAAAPPGAAFDRAYVEVQVDAHDRALAVLDRVAGAARAGDLPAFVARTRAEVQQHLDEARALRRRLP